MTNSQDPNEFILSDYPRKLKVRHVRSLMLRNDEEAKKRLVDVIYHRLHRRYIVPMKKVPVKYKSGFLMMASACLLIEAFQSFREGLEYTKERGAGEERFLKFFTEIDDFKSLAQHTHDFYTNVRCGILHQAETYQGWRVRRDKNGPLFDPEKGVINANAFLKALSRSLRAYCKNLRASDWESEPWKTARKKLGFICDHCAPTHRRNAVGP
jgi:hypothetical protein